MAELEQRLLDCVREEQDVVLGLSFWSRGMRDHWRALLTPSGITPEIVQVVASRETALAQMEARAAGHGDDFRLPPALAAAYFDHFELPTADEGPISVVRTD